MVECPQENENGSALFYRANHPVSCTEKELKMDKRILSVDEQIKCVSAVYARDQNANTNGGFVSMLIEEVEKLMLRKLVAHRQAGKSIESFFNADPNKHETIPVPVAVVAEVAAQRPDVNPWHPMTSTIDLKHIGKCGEELAESGEALAIGAAAMCRAGAAVSRCIIQGVMDHEPVTGKLNKTWLEEEFADVEGNIELCKQRFDLDRTAIEERKQRKMAKLVVWHRMA